MSCSELFDRYLTTRALSIELCRPLRAEDHRIQSMPDVSPPWWNLGHTSWFFAKNVLEPAGLANELDRRLEYVLNSYYESLGARLPRTERGLQTRPTTDEIYAYRRSVDERIEQLLEHADDEQLEELGFLLTTGVQHEQQHQELLVTEIKHILGSNADGLREPYGPLPEPAEAPPPPRGWVDLSAGLCEIGNLEGGWAWDNELPVHKTWLDDFSLSTRLVTNREYLKFIDDGGYRQPLLWLSNGWAAASAGGWEAPLYWHRRDGAWWSWTLGGDRPLDLDEPVAHVSFYEAEAFARWAGARLPTEREWEHGARTQGLAGDNFLETRRLHPARANGPAGALLQTGGDLWEWTSSHYEPYPGYRPFAGNLTEYNGKFMDNQRVLRGGSCATPRHHLRASYRNFWPAPTRFQLTGIRLARTL